MNREEIIEFLKGKVKELEYERENKYLELKKMCDNNIFHININEIENLYDELEVLEYIKGTIENLATNDRLKNEIADERRLKYHLGGFIDTSLLVKEVDVNKIKILVENKSKYDPGRLKEISLHLKCMDELNKYALKLMNEI